ncbi:Intraflagellar transport protein 57 [Clydaea vesicula]|uniref:Intraflagellar transport protein 57 n=1 Tax=Clydaea vesicula TaxID=447962 RepID=A0AAD5UB69_9FUNG|nr:Intraflagellar transport protein 57 [Clydaea vesicula]
MYFSLAIADFEVDAFIKNEKFMVKICGGDLDKPQQFDDPNATVSNILAAAKSLQINFDNGPNKIKQGNGEFVVQLLTMLSERALQIKKFVFQKPSHKTEDFAEEAEVDHEAEVTTENVEEHLFLNQEDDDEDMYVAEIKKKNEERPLTSIMPSVDSSDWKLEVERVSPLLKVQIQNDNKDWRIHLEQISFHYSKISNLFVSTSENLKLLHKEVEKTLEKINSREKYINSQFETQTEEFRVLQEQLSMLKQKHSVSNSNVTDLTTELSRISEELDSVKVSYIAHNKS